MNIKDLFTLDSNIISALKVQCEDLEFERDVYLDYMVANLVKNAQVQVTKARVKDKK